MAIIEKAISPKVKQNSLELARADDDGFATAQKEDKKEGIRMPYIVLIGRVLFSAIFILSSWGLFSQAMVQYAANQGVPFPALLVPLSGIIALLGGISVLIGYKARFGAWLLVIFLVPVTFTMHKFWAITDPMAVQIQQAMFMKNIAMIGTALLITYFGSGPLSIDKHDVSLKGK